ncbi:MAG TPA: DUF6249 domain-containing protein [Flavipsychrobacter sp.]|nr:DUF6249 domain-containing protein [Flavipsychrobacter sp.]
MEATQAMIPIVMFICMAITAFGIYYLRNKENMALIERGINPRESYKKFGSLTYLKYGLLLIGVGLGLLLAYAIDESLPKHGFSMGPDRPALYFSLIGICGGLGLVISYFIERKEMQKHQHKD